MMNKYNNIMYGKPAAPETSYKLYKRFEELIEIEELY